MSKYDIRFRERALNVQNNMECAEWICGEDISGCPEYIFNFNCTKEVASANLYMTAMGVYLSHLNGELVGDFFLAPGCTAYQARHQVQTYDITNLIHRENELRVAVGSGWYCGKISRGRVGQLNTSLALIARIDIKYADGTSDTFFSDENWEVEESKIRFADIYDGEHYDATFVPEGRAKVKVCDYSKGQLIHQQGESIVFMEKLTPVREIITPKGERVLDFGQEITGIVSFTVGATKGDIIRLSCAEVLDKDGNFYTENYRDSKSEMIYTCRDGVQSWQPQLSFYGFRYIRVEGTNQPAKDFIATVVCSDLVRTGRLTSGHKKLNRLFDNIIWGQKGNFLDIPTDCPQRDERQGWTGDAQVFVNTACYQYNTKRFFEKWLDDMKAEQLDCGAVPNIIPNMWGIPADEMKMKSSSAWADAAVICPWEVYRHYGDIELLESHFEMMKKRVDYIGAHTDVPDLWIGYTIGDGHYGDWLGLDAKEGSYTGSSRKDFIGSAYYYHVTRIFIEAGKALGKDMSEYEALRDRILVAFRKTFGECFTQTECALSLHFGLAENPAAIADQLEKMIHDNGDCLTTGFVGTPYLLYALSENGRFDTAYTLLIQEKFPSWLYSVNQGATTIWEHWDGKKSDGSFWSSRMNSFNHYAYGSVAGWVYEVAAGITPLEAGFGKLRIAPSPDPRLGWLRAEHDTSHGKIISEWVYEDERISYRISTPVKAVIVIDGVEHEVEAGDYLF